MNVSSLTDNIIVLFFLKKLQIHVCERMPFLAKCAVYSVEQAAGHVECIAYNFLKEGISIQASGRK